MSLLSRRATAPLPAAPEVPPDASPVERLTIEHEADCAAFRESGARVADLRRALDAMEANPLDYPEAGYSKGLDDLRRALAVAADKANRASARKAQSAEALEAAQLAAAVESRDAVTRAFVAALESHAALVRRHEAEQLESLALVSDARAAQEANAATLRAAGKTVERLERLSLASEWPSVSSARRPFLIADALVKWLDPKASALRLAEEAERIRLRDATVASQERLGVHGPEVQARRIQADRAALKVTYPGLPVDARAIARQVPEEVKAYRLAAGLDGEGQ